METGNGRAPGDEGERGHSERGRSERELFAPSASAEEAAAIVAALELFMRGTAVRRAAVDEDRDRWRRAALLEGVAGEPQHDLYDPWINT